MIVHERRLLLTRRTTRNLWAELVVRFVDNHVRLCRAGGRLAWHRTPVLALPGTAADSGRLPPAAGYPRVAD